MAAATRYQVRLRARTYSRNGYSGAQRQTPDPQCCPCTTRSALRWRALISGSNTDNASPRTTPLLIAGRRRPPVRCRPRADFARARRCRKPASFLTAASAVRAKRLIQLRATAFDWRRCPSRQRHYALPTPRANARYADQRCATRTTCLNLPRDARLMRRAPALRAHRRQRRRLCRVRYACPPTLQRAMPRRQTAALRKPAQHNGARSIARLCHSRRVYRMARTVTRRVNQQGAAKRT